MMFQNKTNFWAVNFQFPIMNYPLSFDQARILKQNSVQLHSIFTLFFFPSLHWPLQRKWIFFLCNCPLNLTFNCGISNKSMAFTLNGVWRSESTSREYTLGCSISKSSSCLISQSEISLTARFDTNWGYFITSAMTPVDELKKIIRWRKKSKNVRCVLMSSLLFSYSRDFGARRSVKRAAEDKRENKKREKDV